MLTFFTIVIMLAVAYAFMVEGLFTACTMCINVFLAGLIAFNFFEPLARWLQEMDLVSFLNPAEFQGRAAYEDAICIVLVFCLALFGLRAATNHLANLEIDFPQIAQRGGGAVFGLMTGYLVSGILVCTFQTLPFHVNFMGFEPEHEEGHLLRRVLPPDRVWLALMHRGSQYSFSNATPAEPFDPDGNYELRYARYRRYDENRGPLPYYGEFDRGSQQTQLPGPDLPSLPGGPALGPVGPAPGPAGPAPPKPGNTPAPGKGKQN